jgi:hypothetical protein
MINYTVETDTEADYWAEAIYIIIGSLLGSGSMRKYFKSSYIAKPYQKEMLKMHLFFIVRNSLQIY